MARTSGRSDGLGAVRPVVVRSASAQVADQIVEAIKADRFKVGERLPSEREMAVRFEVSRPTIREALAALELAGLVKVRRGSGTVVTGSSLRAASWGRDVLPPQVFEARLVIEPQLAALAATKCYPEDMRVLRKALEDLEEEFARTAAYESDLPVHRAIAAAARNPILAQSMEQALEYTKDELWVDLRRKALAGLPARRGHVDQVRRVVQCIEQGLAEEAADVWREHLIFFRDEMLGR